MRKIHLFIAVILFLNVQTAGANDYGTSSARILKQAVGARTFALGEAFSAIADDV